MKNSLFPKIWFLYLAGFGIQLFIYIAPIQGIYSEALSALA